MPCTAWKALSPLCHTSTQRSHRPHTEGLSTKNEIPRNQVIPERHHRFRDDKFPKLNALTTTRVSQHQHRDTHDKPNSCTGQRSEEHTSELQSRFDLVCRLLLEKK